MLQALQSHQQCTRMMRSNEVFCCYRCPRRYSLPASGLPKVKKIWNITDPKLTYPSSRKTCNMMA